MPTALAWKQMEPTMTSKKLALTTVLLFAFTLLRLLKAPEVQAAEPLAEPEQPLLLRRAEPSVRRGARRARPAAPKTEAPKLSNQTEPKSSLMKRRQRLKAARPSRPTPAVGP